MPTLQQKTPAQAFILSEANSSRSCENYLLSHGKKLSVGEVAKDEPEVDLTTTADTHSSTVLDTLAATTGLVVGDIYRVSGAGIPAGATFTYGGASAGTLSQAASATANGVSVHLQRYAGIGPWLTGGDTPAGISMCDIDATGGELFASVIARDAEVNLKLLIFPNMDDDDSISAVITALAGNGIICRD
jgi:hypothetical protein